MTPIQTSNTPSRPPGARLQGAVVSSILMFAAIMINVAAPASAVGADGWGAVQLIDKNPNGGNYNAQVAVDDQGRGLAVWEFYDGFNYQVHASRFLPGQGWGFPDRLYFFTGPSETDPDVAMDGAGNGMAVWTQFYGSYQIAAAPYTPGEGWGLVEIVALNFSADKRDAEVAMGPDGNATVVWVQCCDPGSQVWGSTFDPDTGWGGATQINVGSADDAAAPRVGVDASGRAVAVWVEDAGSTWALNASRFTPGAGWSAPAVVAAPGPVIARPALAVSANGDALAMWERYSNLGDIEANLFSSTAGWGAAAVFASETTGPVEGPRVAMDAAGNGVAVWHAYTAPPDNKNTIRARTYDYATGWSAAVRELENVSYDRARASADVSMDAQGNALAVWADDGTLGFDIKSADYSPAVGWSGAHFAEDNAHSAGHDYNGAGGPRVALGASGAVATWMALVEGQWAVWGNSFEWPDTTPPVVTITSPAIGALTNRSVIQVRGLTEVGARVSVNGIEAAVAADGSFSVRVSLSTGTNFVNVIAQDVAGNAASATRIVTFDDPVTHLEADLAAAQVALLAAGAQLDEAQARLDNLTTDANATQAELDAAQANVTAAQANAAAAQSSAGAVALQLAEARSLLNQTRVELAATQAELAAARVRINATNTTTQPPAPAADLGPAIVLGLAGVALGGGGLAMGVQSARKAKRPPAQ